MPVKRKLAMGANPMNHFLEEYVSLKYGLRTITGVTRITQSDKHLYRKYFKNRESSYSSSWLYILRASRGYFGEIGLKCHRDNFLVSIGIRNGTLYLVRPMGKNKFLQLRKLCQELRNITKLPIIIRKIDKELLDLLCAKHPNEFSTKIDRRTFNLEDDSYEEQAVLSDSLFTKELEINPQAKLLFRKVKRFENSQIEITKRCWDKSHTQITPSRLELINNLSGGNAGKINSYRPMITEGLLKQGLKDNYISCIYYSNNDSKIHGFYLGEGVSQRKFGLYCALSSTAHPGITEWMDVDFFRGIVDSGFNIITLGGAENHGVYNYIKKLLPVSAPQRMFSMIYIA